MIDRLNETAKHFLGYDPHFIKPNIIKYLTNEMLHVTCFVLSIIQAPGHTPGSGCFYIEKKNALFTGDTLFREGVGRTDLSYSSKEDLTKSLKKIFKLPRETIIYSGHGEDTILEDEKIYFN